MERRQVVLVRLFLLGTLGAVGIVSLGPVPDVASQSDHVYFIPDAQAPNRALPSPTAQEAAGVVLAEISARPGGMEGWGSSSIDVQSASNGSLTYGYELTPIEGPAIAYDGSTSQSQARVDLGGMLDAVPGFYHGRVTTRGDAGVTVRTHWAAAGGATAYEAPEPARDLVLPMLVKTVGTLGTELWIMNTVAEGVLPAMNMIEYSVHANTSGEEILEFFQELEAGESGHEDTAFNPRFQLLPERPGGGYIGALWLHGEEDLAVIQYLEDYGGTATAAFSARPVSKGATWQVLPCARTGERSGSLIGIASVADVPGSVTISYLQAGTGRELARHSTALAARGATYVDLGGRGLGSMPPPAQLREDFDGSVLVEADVPVLSAIFDHSSGAVVTGSGYNAFGRADLADSVAVTGIGVGGGKSSELMIQNGEPRDIEVRVTLRGPNGETVDTAQNMVPRGARWTLVPTGGGDLEHVSALIEATGGVAVLTRDWNIGSGPDCAVSAGVALAGGAVPTTPSRTATVTATSGTPTLGTPPPTGQTPTATSPTREVTITPSPVVSSEPLDFELYLPRTLTRRPGD